MCVSIISIYWLNVMVCRGYWGTCAVARMWTSMTEKGTVPLRRSWRVRTRRTWSLVTSPGNEKLHRTLTATAASSCVLVPLVSLGMSGVLLGFFTTIIFSTSTISNDKSFSVSHCTTFPVVTLQAVLSLTLPVTFNSLNLYLLHNASSKYFVFLSSLYKLGPGVALRY